jgi:hypothetical protein
VQLQNARAKFEKQGIKIAAISYDSPAILKDFSERHKIDFPLLADPDSRIIREYDVLNAEATGMTKGMARPGYFYIDASGSIREKYFGIKYTDRFTPNNVIGRLFPELSEEVTQNISAPHLQLSLQQSDRDVITGNRVRLVAEIELPPGVHVYAPGVQGYRPIHLALNEAAGLDFAPATYPEPKILYLPAIDEHVPVFEGKFRVAQDVILHQAKPPSPGAPPAPGGETLSVTGELQYQACDDKVCYPPASVPVAWNFQVFPIDLVRAPENIQHK